MTFNQSLDIICQRIAESGMQSIELELAENLALHTCFANESEPVCADVRKLAHELNNRLTPLTMLSGCFSQEILQYLQTRLSSRDLFEVGRQLHETSNLIQGTVDNITSLLEHKMKKESTGRYVPFFLSVSDLFEGANKFVESNLARMGSHDVRVSYKNQKTKVYCDEDALKSVFLDLFKNAYESMQGVGTIDVCVSPISVQHIYVEQNKNILALLRKRIGRTSIENDAYVAIKVCNSGPHIPDLIDGDLFTTGVTTKKRGHGIGMQSVADHVQDNRGFYTWKNCHDLGETSGVEFTVYLPTVPLVDYVAHLPLKKDYLQVFPEPIMLSSISEPEVSGKAC